MDNKKVLAVVGNREITEGDLQTIIRSLDPQRAMQFQTEEGQQRLLEEIIDQELMYLDAVDNNMPNDEAYQKELKKISENFLKQYAINQLIKDVKVDDKEIEDYYENHKEYFRNPAAAKASHILVDTEEKAESILKEINEGLSFEEAASKYSSCPSKAQGGNLGEFSKGKMVPEFEEAVFNMEKGEISKPVKTQFGYHLIKLFDRKKEDTKTLSEVKDRLTQQLLGQKQQQLYLEKVEGLRNKYTVTMNI
ncbi:peptidylprolyl isomerase [Clostridium formicaceticum]|uniref:Peptidyl-prolyl cis-trans isomerase Cbf2 n=1 Tax=Clostridium formicaceticum TaxID=1497 RepID=A0AAC9WKC5_9CLOT|nr:peptidylprolyl isomerase [Clostridium formicaceticum]AOY75237.1 peptidylprolyl isomerase [Clostridium formicaceticum]ARE89670.1 Putative peptidyl-prolyl cis-trans isomerase Cbf2 precursor [Clostridium formicaceticum]